GGFNIPCPNHPDKLATQNCMNCGKPLCMECVRANGYYCSDACRQTVAAAEPDAVEAGAEQRESIGEQVEQTMAKLGRVLKWAGMAAVVAGAGWIGWLAFQKLTAPKGQVTARMQVVSGTDRFQAKIVPPDDVLVQVNGQLSLLK